MKTPFSEKSKIHLWEYPNIFLCTFPAFHLYLISIFGGFLFCLRLAHLFYVFFGRSIFYGLLAILGFTYFLCPAHQTQTQSPTCIRFALHLSRGLDFLAQKEEKENNRTEQFVSQSCYFCCFFRFAGVANGVFCGFYVLKNANPTEIKRSNNNSNNKQIAQRKM